MKARPTHLCFVLDLWQNWRLFISWFPIFISIPFWHLPQLAPPLIFLASLPPLTLFDWCLHHLDCIDQKVGLIQQLTWPANYISFFPRCDRFFPGWPLSFQRVHQWPTTLPCWDRLNKMSFAIYFEYIQDPSEYPFRVNPNYFIFYSVFIEYIAAIEIKFIRLLWRYDRFLQFQFDVGWLWKRR